jgi:preprotein translocase subunit SecA
MFVYLAKKIFGTRNDRILKMLKPVVLRINDLERRYAPMSDDELRGQTVTFQERLSKGESLDAALRCSVNRWSYPASQDDRRDANR